MFINGYFTNLKKSFCKRLKTQQNNDKKVKPEKWGLIKAKILVSKGFYFTI